MNTVKTTLLILLLAFVGVAAAGDGHKNKYKHGHKRHKHVDHQQLYDYARVVDVRPLYRRVEVSTPVRECWQEPVYHTHRQQPKSAGGMLAGGLLGGIIGHQIGDGRGQKVATAVGTLIGAQIGHEAVNGHLTEYDETFAGYEEFCETQHRVSYEEVIDGYDVTYRYRGQTHQIEMPYDPGERIKMRIRITPVI